MHAYSHVSQLRPRKAFALVSLAVAGLAALAACTPGRGGSVAYEPTGFVAPDESAVIATPAQQRIGPFDKLRITTFQVADLTGEFNVDGAGNIIFPLIGTVQAQGKLPEELAQHIASRLGERHLRSPNVQVAMLERAQQTITVDGAVRQPGVKEIRGATTLMQAVAMAQGTSEEANPSRVVVFRTINGQRMAAAFDLRAIRRAQAEDPAIYGNDIVVVDGTRTRAIWREIMAALPIIGMFRPY